jgi:peptidoglycan/xylan/chitin deacetylase (PgdA/CDA1 family)
MARLGTMLLSSMSPSGSRGRLLIFTYHRVLERPDPLLPDEADAAVFDRQTEWIARYCHVLPVCEAVRMLREGSLPPRAACITFDDGYANNHDVAMPILLRRGLPATVFVTVDAVERGVMWNDLVIEAVRLRASRANAAVPEIGAVLEKLKYLPLEDRWNAAAELYREAGGRSPPRLMMTPEMVRAMARAGFEIGAHTVNHPILKRQPPEEARREIELSHSWLTELLGVPPVSFAYPNGRPGRDFDQTHARMVQEAGFESAVSTEWGCASTRSNLFALPRLVLWDRTATRFWARLLGTYARSYLS